jgi:chromosome segregation ATPase
MKTIEELEAELETVTRERDLSLSAWESAGMTGCTAQSAMLELARQLEQAQERIELLTELRDEERDLNEHFHQEIQAKHASAEQAKRERDEARAEVKRLQQCWQEASDARSTEMACRMIAERACDEAREALVALTTAKAEADLEIATLTTALDERDLEAERGLEQYDRLVRERDEARAATKVWQETYDRANAHAWEQHSEIDRLVRENATLHAMLDGRMPDTWREDIETLTHQLADATNETTRVRLEAKRAGEDAYRRGAEAMRDECIGAACGFYMGTTGFCNGDEDELEAVLEALPIPEEP